MPHWQPVYKTILPHQAEIIKGLLESEGYQAVLLNKQDQSYHFGHCEILVPAEEVIHVVKLLHERIGPQQP